MTRTQLDLSFARRARDKGMKKAIDHADEVHPSWSERAYELLKAFILVQKEKFLAEDFRMAIISAGLIEEPPHNRAFGGLFMRACKAGLIERVEYAPVKNWKAHRAMASVWRKT